MEKENESEYSQLFWSISPVYYAAHILGLAPYSVRVEKGKTHYRLTKLSLFYSVFVTLILFLGLIPVVQYQKLRLESKIIDKISKYSDLYRTINGFILCATCMICSLINRHDMCQLLDEMSDFDEHLGYLGIIVNYKGHYRKYLIGVTITYILMISFFFSDFIMFVIMEGNSFWYWASCISSSVIIFSTFANFVGYVYMIIARFKILNDYILRLSRTMVTRPLPRINFWTTKSSLGTASSTSKQSNNNSSADHRKSITIANFEYNPLNTLCKMHDRLCEWSKRLNAVYSIQILLLTSTTFGLLVIQLYFFYLMLSKNDLYVLTLHKAWTSAIWGILYFMLIFITSFFCSKTRDMVEMFCLQMFHQKIEFTACGFFVVDFSVLYMIMGAVTTYLVFLVQFEMASGVFPMPSSAAVLCTTLPPPSCFGGPFVAVDQLIDIFNKIQLPDQVPPPIMENGCDTKLFDMARSVHWIVDDDGVSSVQHRKRRKRAGDDSDDDDLNATPPVNDIYRQRQQKRHATS